MCLWIVEAGFCEERLRTFAALPVGARSMVLILYAGRVFTSADTMPVFPVPAYPSIIKMFVCGELNKNSHSLTASCCWSSVKGY
mgnify:CR=1 FL=1